MPTSNGEKPDAKNMASAVSAHVEFFNELGVEGWRREPEWRARPPSPSATPSQGEGAIDGATRESADEAMALKDSPERPGAAPVELFTSAQALAAVRADVGDDCSRCKLH